MGRFEILCVTMNQRDFSKLNEMNIHSDIVYANQADNTAYEELSVNGHKAKMITTNTRGVGKNRNIALLYATADYCLFADDDCCYYDNVEDVVVKEFTDHPDADVFIFHLESNDPLRKLQKYSVTHKYYRFQRRPWGGARIAFRLKSIQKANIWFNTLFGGGCIFPSGEDSMWLNEVVRKGLTIYVSNQTIGTLSFDYSSWFTGVNEKYFFAKGAHFQAEHKYSFYLWALYFASRTSKMTELKFCQRMDWMRKGRSAYESFISFEEYTGNRT